MSAHVADPVVYKICGAVDWAAAEERGVLPWSADDLRDGYVHLSTAEHVVQTARLHYRGRDDLWLLAVSTAALGEALRWEPSRGGAAFPHLYGDLPRTAVTEASPLPRRDDAELVWPQWCPVEPAR